MIEESKLDAKVATVYICPGCGQEVEIVTSDEGTGYYKPKRKGKPACKVCGGKKEIS